MIDSRATRGDSSREELRFTRSTVALLLLGALLVGALAGAASAFLVLRAKPTTVNTTPAAADRELATSAIQVADRFTVAITLRGVTPGPGTPTARARQSSLGTGIILDAEGHILTTSQVLSGYEQVQVIFYDGRPALASLLGIDQETGLAVLRVTTTIPDEPVFFSVSKLKVGEQVVAVGTRLSDNKRTADVGTIATLGFQAELGGDLMDNLIQTDASAPDGATGGPLVNLRGEVVGLTVQPARQPGGWSLALPSDTFRGIARRVATGETDTRASLGIITYETITPEEVKPKNLTQTGALVGVVLPKSPAAKAGLHTGDLIISVDGVALDETNTLGSVLATYQPGRSVKLQYVRNKKILRTNPILLVRKPASQATPTPGAVTP